MDHLPKDLLDAMIADCARTCHEVNRAYCRALGDDSQLPWAEAPDWQRSSAVQGVPFLLGNPDAGPEASHESWMRDKVSAGWVYGEVKDASLKTHPCIKPFADLPTAQRAKDFIFHAIVRELMAEPDPVVVAESDPVVVTEPAAQLDDLFGATSEANAQASQALAEGNVALRALLDNTTTATNASFTTQE